MRGAGAQRRGARSASELRPLRWTALRVPADRRPPPPSAFGRWGERSYLVPPARVSGAEGIEVGDDVVVLEDAGLDVDAAAGARLTIGDRTRLAVGVEIRCTTSVRIGRAVSSSDHAAIVDSWGDGGPPGGPVVIEDGAYLGYGSVVGPGVRVGAGAFVGEGAVVLSDVPAHAVVYGNPAVVVERYGARA